MITRPSTSATVPADGAAEARDRATQEIRSRFLSGSVFGLPKHAQLRKAILAAIGDGTLKPGEQLAPEQALTVALGVSLGTVRRALDQLGVAGVLRREHGHGTFVGQPPRAIEDNWHFRFFTADGRSVLPVYARVVERGLVHLAGPWSDVLGDDPAGFVRFNRLFDVSGKFVCYSEFYISATRFGRILDRPIDNLEAANLRKILALEFKAPTLYLSQRARVETLTERTCELLAIERGGSGMKLELIGHCFEDTPITYQTIWIPPTRYPLDLSRVRPIDPKE